MPLSCFRWLRFRAHSTQRIPRTTRLRPSFDVLEDRQLPSIVLQSFDGTAVPTDGDGDAYPNEYAGVGAGSVSINSADSISGKSLKLHLTSGEFYPQFNPYNYNGNP